MTQVNEKQDILIYQTDDGQTLLDVQLENDTVWLSQAQMVELFDRERSVITQHIFASFRHQFLSCQCPSQQFDSLL